MLRRLRLSPYHNDFDPRWLPLVLRCADWGCHRSLLSSFKEVDLRDWLEELVIDAHMLLGPSGWNG